MKHPAPSLVTPSYPEFVRLARRYNRIPVSLAYHADLETPLSAYLKLAKGPYGFLLESVERNEKVARFSIVGFDPPEVYEAKDHLLVRTAGGRRGERQVHNPLQAVARDAAAVRMAPSPAGLSGFAGGLVGYVAYDAAGYFENLPQQKPDELRKPDLVLMAAENLVVFDHLQETVRLLVNARVGEGCDRRALYASAVRRLTGIRRSLEKPLSGFRELPVAPASAFPRGSLFGFASNFRERDFLAAVERSKGYIRAGDVIQVVLSQRFEKATKADPVTVYRLLRRLNPSPYMFLLKLGGFTLAGSSPEMFVRVTDRVAETRPIAGTRPRGATPAEDAALEAGLLKDEKELAEHVMLVDLGRNDLGRVCEYGTVKVPAFKRVERYSHVMHIVSDVTGRLREGRTAFDVFQSCFPAGTLSGAPKIRAMEIIDELEPSQRGPYGGAVCVFGYDGNMDSAITIRSAVFREGGGGARRVSVQAGAGLVADSDPRKEYQECCNKARAVLLAVHQAESLAGKGRRS
jgi:anthranilate synthase component 1